MRKDVLAPSVGESITEVAILKWARKHGEAVKNGELLLEIESDKATVEIVAEHTGTLQVIHQAGDRIPVGAVIGFIDDSIPATAGAAPLAKAPPPVPGSQAPKAPPLPSATPAAASPSLPPLPGAAPAMAAAPASGGGLAQMGHLAPGLAPSVRRMAASTGINPSQISGSGKAGRVTKSDMIQAQQQGTGATFAGGHVAPSPAPTPAPSPQRQSTPDRPGDRRVPMSMLRARIAERLVQAQHTAAILTTFNEVDMSAVMALRNKHKEAFKAKYGVNLSFMSFFTKASIEALKLIPEVNASIDGKDIVYHDYFDIGIAVGTERGLVVPVVRNADQLSFDAFEKKLGEFAVKARDGKLSMADLSGGTFTISNGGTYGSMMSTPILNPPQSGILGMHNIVERPVAIQGKVEIRPMMYVALSYDHRLIDGKGAVTWLVKLKEFLENPEKLGFSL